MTVVKIPDIDYNIDSEICPGGLMDKVMDSGSIDAGSIPARDAKKDHDKGRDLFSSLIRDSNPRRRSTRENVMHFQARLVRMTTTLNWNL